jgi:uncharacterized protein YkwD
LILLTVRLLAPALAQAQVIDQEERETVTAKAKAKTPSNLPDLPAVVKSIVEQTNEFRHAEGHPKVDVDPKLEKTAQYFADYMARTDKYGHTADGNRPADRAKKHGYDYCIVSENIAYQYNSAGFTTRDLPAEFFKGWKHSPGHRKNMLDADVSETGVAVARSEETGYYYAVQMFGRPKSQAIEFQITNQSDATVAYNIGERVFPLPPRLTRTHQRCRPAQVTFRWPGAEGEARTVQPSNGDHLIVARENGTFRLTKN